MTNLIRVELLRLSSRRVLRLLAVLLFLGIVVVNGYRFTQHSKDDAGSVQRAEQIADQYRRERLAEYEQQFSGVPEDQRPPVEDYVGDVETSHFFNDPRYRMTESQYDVKAVGVLVAVLAFAVGTTYAGAEWSAGTMQALLFWEPRRLRVMLVKLLALALVVVAVSLLAQLLQMGLSAVTASLRGTMEGATAGFYRSVASTSARLAALAVFTSGLAFSLAGLIRNTGGALGAAFLYFAVIENTVRGLRPTWARFLISEQAAAWIEKTLTIYLPPREVAPGNYVESAPLVLTGNRAGLTLAIYLAIAAGAATLLFLRRDVN